MIDKKQYEEEVSVVKAMDAIEDLALSMFPDEPHKAVSLVQAAFVRTAMDLYEDEGLLEKMNESTKGMYEAMKEGRY